MPRGPRIKSEDAIYHIIQRGNERKDIFREQRDKDKFLKILSLKKKKFGFKIYCYCLMDNHFHLIIDSNGADVSHFMKSINISYVIYFNKKYKRLGHLFQGRFKSEIVDSDEYFIQASKYIHLNPVKAGITNLPQNYELSSYGIYIRKCKDILDIVDVGFLLEQFSPSINTAVKRYKEFVEDDNYTAEDKYKRFIEFEDDKGTLEQEREAKITEIINDKTLSQEDIVIELRLQCGLTMRKVAEITGLSTSKVYRIVKNTDSNIPE